jgi:hypothetical protein
MLPETIALPRADTSDSYNIAGQSEINYSDPVRDSRSFFFLFFKYIGTSVEAIETMLCRQSFKSHNNYQ